MEYPIYLRHSDIEQVREKLDGSGDFEVTLIVTLRVPAENPTDALMLSLSEIGLLHRQRIEAED